MKKKWKKIGIFGNDNTHTTKFDSNEKDALFDDDSSVSLSKIYSKKTLN